MHKTKKLTFNRKEITINELTVMQIDAWQESLGKDGVSKPCILDNLMDSSLPISVVRLAVPDLTDDDLKGAPSEIAKVYAAVEELNPFLSKMAENMASLGRELLAGGQGLEKV